MSVTSKVWRVRGPLLGNMTKDDFIFEEETLPAPNDGEFVAEAVFLTVDPYMKGMGSQMKSGEVVSSKFGMATTVARVTESKNPKYPVGTLVLSSCGWRTHFVSDGSDLKYMPDLQGISPSHALGAVGMPGVTANVALLTVCQAKEGEVLVVNAAAGAVGYLIVQIAKNVVGCKVIAYAGTDAKCAWLKELGADYAYNYKTTNLAETLKEGAPDGVDCFVDHVGGAFFATVLNTIRKHGRICLVGEISQYNKTPEQRIKYDFKGNLVIGNEINIKGILAVSYYDRAPEMLSKLVQWNKEGKVKFRERVVDGFENMVDALLSLFSGQENLGKVVIKV